MESTFAKSTFCRKCSEHFDVGRQRAAESVAEKKSSLLDKFSTLITRERMRSIKCFDCKTPQQVSSAAKSSICPHCGTYIDLRDFKINTAFSRSIQTQGNITVTAKGDFTSTKAACGSALLEGNVRGTLFCTGATTVKMKGRISGTIETHHLLVEKNANVEFVRSIKAATAEIKGRVSARITADNVTIRKNGCLEGTVYAKSITVDKGGIFHGELFIGKQELEQPDLLPAKEEPAAGFGDQGTLAFGQAG
jgi:cytoskeletal protein CcmA (bactofilin family)/ribosomal protein S27E